MLPGRLGVRFALEALFLLLLAVGAGLADLRPALILLVMAVAWVLVALIEFTAERIARSPMSYLLPAPPAEEEEPHQRIFWPRPEERTVVAPPAEQPPAEARPEPTGPEAQEEPEPEEVEGPEPEGEPVPAPQAPPKRRRMRSLLRRGEEELESAPHAPPRHVKLLPRRAAPEASRAAREVAELFGSDDDESGKRESGR